MAKFVCTVCGYVYEGDAAPAECPVCHVGADKFKEVEGELTLAAEHEYGITDREILDSITYHTTGRPDMSMLEKIIFIADYIEPNRREIPGLAEIRGIVFQDIDRAVCLSAERTVRYLTDGGKAVDPATISTYEFYKEKREEV